MPWECPACQNVNQDDQKHCVLCGKPRDAGSETQLLENPPPSSSSTEHPTRLMRVTCPSCHAPVLPGLEVCPECNTPILSTDHVVAIPSMTVEKGADSGHVKIKIKTGTDRPHGTHTTPPIDEDITPTRIDERLLSYETMDLEDTRLLRPEPEPKSKPQPESGTRSPPKPPESTPAPAPTVPSPPVDPATLAQKPHPSSSLPRWVIPLWGLALAIGIVAGFFILRPYVQPDYWILDHPAALPSSQATPKSPVAPSASHPPPESRASEETAHRIKYVKLTVTFPLYARVYVDRTFIGTTPLINHPIPPGKHRVTVELPPTSTAPLSLRRHRFTLTAQPDQSVVLHPPITIYGRLYINSYPWSRVTIDGKFIGHTPLILTRIAIGTHTVQLQTPDGRTFEATVDIEEYSIARFSHRFESP